MNDTTRTPDETDPGGRRRPGPRRPRRSRRAAGRARTAGRSGDGTTAEPATARARRQGWRRRPASGRPAAARVRREGTAARSRPRVAGRRSRAPSRRRPAARPSRGRRDRARHAADRGAVGRGSAEPGQREVRAQSSTAGLARAARQASGTPATHRATPASPRPRPTPRPPAPAVPGSGQRQRGADRTTGRPRHGRAPDAGPAAAAPPPWNRVPGHGAAPVLVENRPAEPASRKRRPTAFLEPPRATAAERRGRADPAPRRRHPRRPRPARHGQAALQVRRLDPWSVLKLALVLGVALFFVWLVAVGVLYGVLDGMGVWSGSTAPTRTWCPARRQRQSAHQRRPRLRHRGGRRRGEHRAVRGGRRRWGRSSTTSRPTSPAASRSRCPSGTDRPGLSGL